MADLNRSVRVAGRRALPFAAFFLIYGAIRAAIGIHLPHTWESIITFSLLAGLGGFGWVFVSTLVRLPNEKLEASILSRVKSGEKPPDPSCVAFVTMEYYGLLLNRTFLVFVAPDGLYGWKVHGLVSARWPSFFEPYAKMLQESSLPSQLDVIKDLSKLKDGFFIPRSEFTSVIAINSPKWIMGRIPHSGSIQIRLASGSSRELILLGRNDPDKIRDKILSAQVN